MNNWHTRDISEIVLETGTDINHGRKNLSSDRKRKKNNKIFLLPTADSATIIKRMASDASLSLMLVVYLIASLLGRFSESIIAISIIGAAFACGSYIKYRSSLRISNSYRMLLPQAKVVENGTNFRLSVYDVEIGDLINFAQGDIIPADARLVTSSALFVAEREINELTGHSEYKKYQKDHDYVSNDIEEFHSPNMVYAGSMVISGKGSAIVSAIGNDTVICKNHNGISIVSENDSPEFLRVFLRKSRKFSLATLITAIPVILLVIYFQTLRGNSEVDFLSMFVLALALAATSMSELSISSAEAIITKELLPSSLISKIEKRQESKITKLSAAEELAQTDTLMILCPEALIDERRLVRRIYFSGRQYRFDALRSSQINDFIGQIAPFYLYMSPSSMTDDDKIIGDFCNSARSERSIETRPKFIKNFPVSGARSCVYEFDGNGMPISYITKLTDLTLIQSCTAFRTEGGGLWKLEDKDLAEIQSVFDEYRSSATLEPTVFYSHNKANNALIFEGIIGVGQEYPYSNGDLSEALLEAGVQPVLILEEENEKNIEIAYNCGLCKNDKDIAICSEYEKAGLTVSDAHLATKIYVGFGRKGTQSISHRFAENTKKVLPIIKDSANRRDVAPFGVYATHSQKSFDSVKIASAVSIIPNTSDNRGGLSDALKAVQACSMAFLKLGIYKNYLVFSSVMRILTVCIPLITGHVNNVLTPISLLICGFFCDFAALLSIAYSKGIPVKARNTVSETRKLFYPSTSFLCAFCSLIQSIIVLCTIGYLTKTGVMAGSDASLFVSVFIIVTQIMALGGFLLILHGRTRSHRFNFCYFTILLITIIFIAGLFFVPSVASVLGASMPDPIILPYLLTAAAVSAIIIVLIVGNLSSFSATKRV